MAEIRATGTSRRTEAALARSDGSEFLASLTISSIRDGAVLLPDPRERPFPTSGKGL